MATKFASNNPFRTPPITPEHTGNISVAESSSAATTDTTSSNAIAQHANPPRNEDLEENTERREAGRQDRIAELAEELDAVSIVEPAPSEPPPAYTPSANQYMGEATVEFGPNRPFQPAPPPLMTPQPTGLGYGFPPVQSLPQMSTGGSANSWSNYPGRARRNNVEYAGSLIPPPRHPLSPTRTGTPRVSSAPPPQLRPLNNSDHRPSRPLSEFAQDFYAAGGDVVAPADDDSRDTRRTSYVSSTSSGHDEPEHFERERRERPNAPPTPSSSFAPPSGPPPLSQSLSSSQYTPPSDPPPSTSSTSTSVRNNQQRPADDGKPTSSPTPGRPLLHRGRVLVYPLNYECHKCSCIISHLYRTLILRRP